MRRTIYPTTAETAKATTATMTDADLDDIREAFNKIDVDGSGTITKEELYNRFLGEDSKFNVSKKDFDVLFDIIDKDVRTVYRLPILYIHILYYLYHFLGSNTLHLTLFSFQNIY